MFEVEIPGYRKLRLEHLVFDYNGTLACDGILVSGVKEKLESLAGELQIHVLTADTFGKARSGLAGLPCKLSILPPGDHAVAKRDYVSSLGADRTACIGNGRNDRLMLEEAALGVLVLQEEGAAVEALLAADVVCAGILSALDLFINPLRLVAALRS